METITKPKPAELAAKFLADAKADGWTVTLGRHSDAVVTIEKTFTPGDTDAYLDANAAAWPLLRQCPTVTYGSTWGTDSASVGGHAGLTGGYYRLSKSGVSKRFANAVKAALR